MSVCHDRWLLVLKLTSLKLAYVSFYHKTLPGCHIHANCNIHVLIAIDKLAPCCSYEYQLYPLLVKPDKISFPFACRKIHLCSPFTFPLGTCCWISSSVLKISLYLLLQTLNFFPPVTLRRRKVKIMRKLTQGCWFWNHLLLEGIPQAYSGKVKLSNLIRYAFSTPDTSFFSLFNIY